MKKALWIVGVIVVLGGVYLLLNFRDNIINHPSSGRDIIAYGDSLAAGVGSHQGGGFVDYLAEEVGVPIVNLGVSGNTTQDGLDRINKLDNYKPRIVIVLLGGNDFLQKVPEATVFANLDKLILEIQKRGAMVLLLGVRSGLLGDRYNGDFEDLAKKRGAAYVPDVLSGIFGHGDLMSDEIHPNDKGYKMIAEKIRPVLTNLLR